jgi:hypothetical protein
MIREELMQKKARMEQKVSDLALFCISSSLIISQVEF